jgi:hypothetical protein
MEQVPEEIAEGGRSRALVRYFSNPWIGILGSIASVIGLGLAVYFYRASIRDPELTVYVHPVRSSVVEVGEASGLSVTFNGKEISTDVTAVQVAFWNDGRQAIRTEDVLSELTIATANAAPILEARLRKVTRKLAGIELDISRKEEGAIIVKWKILEHNDGGIIQIIFAGSTSVEISANAAIVGQPEVFVVSGRRMARSTREEFSRWQQFARARDVTFYVFCVVVILFLLGIVFMARRSGVELSPSALLAILVILVMLGLAYALSRMGSEPAIPFEF